MKQTFKGLVASAALFVSLLGPLTPLASADTVDVFKNNPGCASGSGAAVCGGTGDGLFSVVRTVISVMLIVGGVIAVIMIILGGIRYITSNGDANDVKAAKDTILYSVIGLVITAGAYMIVNYVVGKI